MQKYSVSTIDVCNLELCNYDIPLFFLTISCDDIFLRSINKYVTIAVYLTIWCNSIPFQHTGKFGKKVDRWRHAFKDHLLPHTKILQPILSICFYYRFIEAFPVIWVKWGYLLNQTAVSMDWTSWNSFRNGTEKWDWIWFVICH